MRRHPVDVALDLAQRGIHVFPCKESKAPACPHGHLDASADPDVVCRLWRDHPGPLIGTPTGAISGFDVLDVDRKHPEALAWLRENRHRLPETRVHRTRSGGLHIFFKHDDRVKCGASRLVRGIDTRGAGGYVVWWAAEGLPILSAAPAANWPEWLIDALQPTPEPAPQSVRRRIYSDGRLAGIVRAVALAPEGQRNGTTFWAACRCAEMIEAGEIDTAFALAVLIEAAARAGLPKHEAERTARSGIKRTSGN